MMRTIVKLPEPDFWSEYRRRNPNIRYSDLDCSEEGRDLRKKIREYMIDNQHGLCAYCCREIDDKHSLNEHIAPQQQYPDRTMDYENLVACCNADPDTCEKRKKNKYDPDLFISPLQKNCEEHFSFSFDGTIRGITPQGKYTVGLLNLNSYRLQQARRAHLITALNYHDKEFVTKYFLTPSECDGKMRQFPDIIGYFLSRGMIY